jgi:hypothetical protein
MFICGIEFKDVLEEIYTMPPYGRGGAGNIQALEQEKARIAADLEANQLSADIHTKGLQPSDSLQHEEQRPYAHTGRGGMGNLVDAQDLKQRIEPTNTAPVSSRTAGVSATATYGRGGAGNRNFSEGLREGEAAKQREGEHLNREKLREDIERGVKESLAMPQKAKVAGSEPY